MRMRFSVHNDYPVLSKKLLELAKAADAAMLHQALAAGSDIVVEAIRLRIRISAKRSRGNLAQSIQYRISEDWFSGKATSATFGWDKVAVRVSKKGRTTYASDYGPVLEYDSKRRLRHLESGFEDSRDSAEAAMLRVLESAITKALQKAA